MKILGIMKILSFARLLVMKTMTAMRIIMITIRATIIKSFNSKLRGEVGVGVGGGDLPCISNDDTTADGDGGKGIPREFFSFTTLIS